MSFEEELRKKTKTMEDFLKEEKDKVADCAKRVAKEFKKSCEFQAEKGNCSFCDYAKTSTTSYVGISSYKEDINWLTLHFSNKKTISTTDGGLRIFDLKFSDFFLGELSKNLKSIGFVNATIIPESAYLTKSVNEKNYFKSFIKGFEVREYHNINVASVTVYKICTNW